MLLDPKYSNTLSVPENLRKMYESSDKSLEKYRLPDQADLEDVHRRSGHQLMHGEFIRRVEKAATVRVWAENSQANPGTTMGFYYLKGGKKTYVCAFEKGIMPEFSIITVDDRNLPVRERRGWRTVLTRLLEQGVLSWEQVHREFGDPQNEVSDRWNANTQQFKR